ncbi:RraA family protein [Thalassospira sp. TSL5-1]|uniref:RraA family protein n=1 Tax=Thalassospira sp. TSL5-1 TaxID=1544451 RepID=UPI00093ADD0E|nr:4-hydroxy-4-methyl-2-oxoglutarate aldolase [Thalassospira sp. TSL5-1]OKH86767.1 4-hydroxy-4-methyl-2-oxoglutarate aldolase [Thalassospira sp. TSL5-1]
MNRYRIDPLPAPLDPALRAKLEQVETATLGHVRLTGFANRTIQALDSKQTVRVGVAVTLALPPMCSTLMHYAVSKIRPGDMLVVDRLGDDRHACLGGAVARAAKQAGAVGVVIDGPVTDINEILDEGLPVWCRGASSLTTRRLNLGGTFNRPIACGNAPVLPGDIVLADASGVVFLPADEAENEADAGIARQGRVARTMERLQNGERLGDITGVVKQIDDAIGANADTETKTS